MTPSYLTLLDRSSEHLAVSVTLAWLNNGGNEDGGSCLAQWRGLEPVIWAWIDNTCFDLWRFIGIEFNISFTRKRYSSFGETPSIVSVNDDFDMVYVSCFGEDCMCLLYSSVLYAFLQICLTRYSSCSFVCFVKYMCLTQFSLAVFRQFSLAVLRRQWSRLSFVYGSKRYEERKAWSWQLDNSWLMKRLASPSSLHIFTI